MIYRAVCDALTASGLIVDDARICEVSARKVEVVGWTGATITIDTLEDCTRREGGAG